MDLFSRFRRAAAPAPLSHVMEVPQRIAGALVKTGKWVVHGPTKQPGILTGVADFPIINVMLVNEVGEDYRAVTCTLADIRIAKLLEIPEKRRPTPLHGASLGYF